MADLGTDISCVEDFTDECAIVTGRRVLAEAIARRLITPRGRLLDDPNYGYDVTGFINDDMGRRELANVRANVRREALKDERVLSALVGVSLALGVLTITVDLTDGAGPFKLVLEASQVSVSVLSVT